VKALQCIGLSARSEEHHPILHFCKVQKECREHPRSAIAFWGSFAKLVLGNYGSGEEPQTNKGAVRTIRLKLFHLRLLFRREYKTKHGRKAY